MTSKERWVVGLIVLLMIIACTYAGGRIGYMYGSARMAAYWSDRCYALVEEESDALAWRVVGAADGIIQLRNNDLSVHFRFKAHEPNDSDFVQDLKKIGYDVGWILVPTEVKTIKDQPPVITGEAYVRGKVMSEELEARGLLRKR